VKGVDTLVGIDPGVGNKPESVSQPITESYTGDYLSKKKLGYLLCFVRFIKQLTNRGNDNNIKMHIRHGTFK
jgi:hypothetical protein